MFFRRSVIVLSLLLPAAVCAQDRKAALADELLTTMKTEKLMDQMQQQMPAMVQQQLQQLNLPASYKPKLDQFVQDMVSYARTMLDWKNLEPEFVAIYSETFSEKELQGVIDFYKSPAGQAFIEKMPVVMNRAMQIQQRQMTALMAHMRESMKTLQAGGEDEKKDGAGK